MIGGNSFFILVLKIWCIALSLTHLLMLLRLYWYDSAQQELDNCFHCLLKVSDLLVKAKSEDLSALLRHLLLGKHSTLGSSVPLPMFIRLQTRICFVKALSVTHPLQYRWPTNLDCQKGSSSFRCEARGSTHWVFKAKADICQLFDYYAAGFISKTIVLKPIPDRIIEPAILDHNWRRRLG